jgi:hypothetical protein
MPKTRKPGLAVVPDMVTNGQPNKKRKREGETAAVTELDVANEASPKKNKNTRSIKEELASPVTSKETPRKRTKRVGL